MHYDYVVHTQNDIVDHNKATDSYLAQTNKVRDRLVSTREKIDAEIKQLDGLITKLKEVGTVGKTTAHVFQHAVETDDSPAATELERDLANLTMKSLEADTNNNDTK